MNIFKKIYCRAYQLAFKLAIPLLPYRATQITDTINKVPLILSEKGIKKVLIVTDKTMRNTP